MNKKEINELLEGWILFYTKKEYENTQNSQKEVRNLLKHLKFIIN